jgi:hypothetical protein
MQICKSCRSLMIGGEASQWLPRMKRLLRRHGTAKETLCVMAETIGPLCNTCIKGMEASIREKYQ